LVETERAAHYGVARSALIRFQSGDRRVWCDIGLYQRNARPTSVV